jgi:mannose-6-phosphate isomerase
MKIPEIIPLPANRVWRTYLGGRTLDLLKGEAHPGDGHFPEDWIASTTRAVNRGREDYGEEGLSRVTVEGKSCLLGDLFARHPEETLGPAHYQKYGANTQFLLKLLDSSIRLHFQCHPTADFAKAHLDSPSGKTEAYVILRIREEVAHPYIYLGFQHPPSKEDFKRTILRQDIRALLSHFRKIPVKPGDLFVVPGGFPHAIGEGIFMMEIMEPTDFAVRIEFERGGYVLPEEARFMGRGVDFALSMFNFEAVSAEEVRERFFQRPEKIRSYGQSGTEYSLIDSRATDCFRVKRLRVTGELEKEEDSFYIGIVSGGAGVVSSGGSRLEVKFGDRFFVPFNTTGVRFDSPAGMDVLLALAPG